MGTNCTPRPDSIMPQISADIPAHNADLVGDQLTTLVVNYRWRRILAPLLLPLCRDSLWTGTDAQIQDATYKAISLIADLYTAEPIGNDVDYLGVQSILASSHIVTVAEVAIPFTQALPPVTHDVGDFWSSGQPTRLTVPAGGDGFYHVFANLQLNNVATGIMARIRKNSTLATIDSEETTVANNVGLSLSGTIQLVAGDYLEVYARTTTVNRTVISILGSWHANFGMYRVGVVAP